MDTASRPTLLTPLGDKTPPPDVTPAPVAPTAPAVGGQIGGYRVVRAVGRGGMGQVYEAFDAELNRTVALKTMLPELAVAADTRERFVQEARALAAVANDHVVTIHAVGEHDRLPFLVMEYLTGETLDARLKRGPVPLPHVLKIGREVANGLAAAHRVGVTHRDVKPDNVLLDARRDRAVLIDFGLANTPHSTPNQSSFRAGTPLYMSPEQVRGESPDPRTDLFSLGVLLYRLCADQMPFQGATVVQWRSQLLSDDPPPPVEEFNPHVPPPLADLIRRLLAKDRADRPASAAAVEWELMQLFQSVLAFAHSGTVTGVTRTPQPDSPPPAQTSAAPHRRSRRWVGVAAGGVLAAAVSAVLFFRPPVPQPTPPPSVAARPKPVSLFDGRTLAGWHGVEGKTDRWEVKGGVLTGTPKGPADQYLLSDREFTDFVLEFEFRWREAGGHTTLLLRAKDGGPPPANKAERVTGLELNLGDDDHFDEVHRRPIGRLYASGGVYQLKTPEAAPNRPIGEWNSVTVTSDRTRLTVVWNGETTFDEDLDKFADKAPQVKALARSKGSVGLRAHGLRAIEFRHIQVTPIER